MDYCPHCNKSIHFEGESTSITTIDTVAVDYESIGYGIEYGNCPACKNFLAVLSYGPYSEAFGFELQPTEIIIFPVSFSRSVALEVPENYRIDFLEACNVLPISPKASAALSRRLLQNILREHFKIKHADLSKEIEDFIKNKGAPAYLNVDIDAVRNVGNFAAHPLKSTSTGAIVDVEPHEAEWLIEVLESLFDFAFVQPKRQQDRHDRLNSKLTDLGKPPMKKP